MKKMKPGAMQEAQQMRANVAAKNASNTPLAAKAANARNLAAFKAANAPAPAATAKAPLKGSLNPIKQRHLMRQRRMAGGGMMKGYAKGGMANCGASMKPNGAKKGK